MHTTPLTLVPVFVNLYRFKIWHKPSLIITFKATDPLGITVFKDTPNSDKPLVDLVFFNKTYISGGKELLFCGKELEAASQSEALLWAWKTVSARSSGPYGRIIIYVKSVFSGDPLA